MITTSIGVQELRKRIGAKAKADPHHRFSGLYTHVWKLDHCVRRTGSRSTATVRWRSKRRGGRR